MGILPLNIAWDRAQSLWSALLNPLLTNPLNGVIVLQNQKLIAGTNIIQHKLGRQLQGWWIISPQAATVVYQPLTAPNNATTLTLISSAAATVSIAVY